MKQGKGAGGMGPEGFGDMPPIGGPKARLDKPALRKPPGLQKGRGGDPFADPLACPPDMRGPPGPPPRGPSFDDEILSREKEINRKILSSYNQSSAMDTIKPLLGIVVVGAIAFSQVSKADMGNAVIYTAMFMMGAGAIYTLFARDTLPPLFSLILKGLFALGLLAAGVWFAATHTESFTPKDKDGRSTYRVLQEETAK